MKLRLLAVVVAVSLGSGLARADSGAGTDFAAQAKLLYRIAACGGTDEVDAAYPKKTIDRLCKAMARRFATYKKKWLDKAAPFIAGVLPTGAPTTVVYPFGGGDLSTALAVFPDATEITTISLEAAGDVRVVDRLNKRQLGRNLQRFGDDLDHLYRSEWSATEQLEALSHSKLPGEVCFALAALVVHGFQPVSLRYFTFEDDGSIAYQTEQELDDLAAELARGAAARKKQHKRSKHYWYEQTSAFANVEIQYVPVDHPDATPRVFRHVLANLDDDHLARNAALMANLAAKGKVAAMTKAASYLLWQDDFSTIRTWLLGSMAFMISDDSGIGPSAATAAGFEQIPFGEFTGPFFVLHDTHDVHSEMRALWKASPKRALPFRFGYPDADKVHGHLLITQPATCAGKVPC